MEKMKEFYPTKVQKARTVLLNEPGACPPALRQAVEAYAAGISGGERESHTLPAELVPYVEKVTRYAYRVTDEDVERLKEAGYSEDAIFEITLAAAVGASLARLERGMEAVEAGYALTDS